MATELTPEFVSANGLPAEPEGQAELAGGWHKRKTAIYTDMVVGGPPSAAAGHRPCHRRGPGRRLGAGRGLDVGRAVGAGDPRAGGRAGARAAVRSSSPATSCERKKPAPDIYLLALERLGRRPPTTLVIEDSRNGLLAAAEAGLRCVMTVNGYTEEEDSSEAMLVVTSLGDPDGETTRVIANRSAAQPGDYITLADLERCLAGCTAGLRHLKEVRDGSVPRSTTSTSSSRRWRRRSSTTRSTSPSSTPIVGDGDFGYSLRNGFEVVGADYDSFDHSSVGAVLKKIGLTISGKVGGVSGPIWGTAFLRAGITAGDKTELAPEDVIAMLRAAIEGIMQRGERIARGQDPARRARPGGRQPRGSMLSGSRSPTTASPRSRRPPTWRSRRPRTPSA